MAARGILHSSGPNLMALLFPLFGLPFVFVGVHILRAGAFALAGRVEIELAEGQLLTTERAWLFRKSQSVRVDKLRRLSVEALPFDITRFGGPSTKIAALKAEMTEGKPLELLRGYPLETLEAFARELTKACAGLSAAAPVEVNVVAEPPPRFDSSQTDKRDHADQPAGSLVRVVEQSGGLTLTVPPAGLVRGSKGLFVFALVWLGLTTGGIGTAIIMGTRGHVVVPILFCGIFTLAGVAMLLPAINMGRRRAIFMVMGDELRLASDGLFGAKLHRWARADLASIHIGPSGMAVNEVPVLELQIEPRAGKRLGLLAGRDEAELRWMATMLRRALKLTAEESSA